MFEIDLHSTGVLTYEVDMLGTGRGAPIKNRTSIGVFVQWHRVSRRWFHWISVLVLCLCAQVAHADDVADEADTLFNLGAEEYQTGNFEGALAHFLASNRLARNKNVLFNIARCYEQLRRFPEAHRYYMRALEVETNAAAITSINQALARIADRVALLEIKTEPPGARIYLDRKDLGERGSAPQIMALPPRTYRVIAELEGYRDATSEPVPLRVGSQRSIALTLEPILGTIAVGGTPGASVRVDADNTPPRCVTPCQLRIAPGQHTLILDKVGMRTTRVPVSVNADQQSSIEPELVADTGSLVVNADELGAAIEIDGVAHGFTPAVLSLPVGPHRVLVRMRGFRPVQRDVVVTADQQARVDIELYSSDSVEAASRVVEPVELAPASVSLISSQELRAMRYPTLFEALRGTRGIFLNDDRSYPEIGFRGFGRLGSYGNRTLVTLDGAPMNDDWIWSSYVGFDQRTDLEDIDHIEVVRGPGSVLYGTSAFSGVINLVTRGLDAPSGTEVGISVAADGVARARARLSQRLGADAGFWASVAAGRSEGRNFFFPEYVADGPPEVAGNARGLDGARFATFTGRAHYGGLSLSWLLNHHHKHIPTGEFETLFGDARTRQSDTRAFSELRLELPIGDHMTSLTRVHGNYYRYRGEFARSPAEEGVESNPYDSFWAGAEQRFVVTAGSALSLSVGAEGQLHPSARQIGETETGGIYLDDNLDFALAALYGSIDLRPLPAVKISAGGRFDYYSTFGSSFNPRLALIVQPYDGGNLKIVAAKAFKAPSIYEFASAYIGQLASVNLQPENIYSAEVEFSQRLGPTVVLTAAVYTNYIADLISLEAAPPSPDGTENVQYQNTDTPVGTFGGELEVRREWKEGWMLAASYSLQQSRYLAAEGIDALLTLDRSPDYREVPNSPMHLASLKGAAPLFGRDLTLMNRLTYEGPRYDVDDAADSATTQTRTDGSLIWDIVISGREARWGLDYSLGVYNAFDSQAHVPVSDEFRQRSIPISGRSFLAALGLTF
jgi:outer membrane receptor protein involved in Fe transport